MNKKHTHATSEQGVAAPYLKACLLAAKGKRKPVPEPSQEAEEPLRGILKDMKHPIGAD